MFEILGGIGEYAFCIESNGRNITIIIVDWIGGVWKSSTEIEVFKRKFSHYGPDPDFGNNLEIWLKQIKYGNFNHIEDKINWAFTYGQDTIAMQLHVPRLQHGVELEMQAFGQKLITRLNKFM